MGIFSESVSLILKCRDVWCKEWKRKESHEMLLGPDHSKSKRGVHSDISNRASGEDELFSGFFKWVFECYENTKDTTHSEIVELLNFVTSPHSHSLYGLSILKEKLSTPNLKKAYRVALAIDNRKGERDHRVRELFEYIVEEDYEFSFYALVCAFFTYHGTSIRTKGKNVGNLRTRSSSRFQQIIFLSAISELSCISSQGAPKMKRRRTSKKRVTICSSLNGLRLKEVSQKVGLATQTVVESWDTFAKHIGFKNAEEMVLPYAIFSDQDLRFKCIKDREEGYAPREQSTSFVVGISPTKEPSKTFTGVTERSTKVDAILRKFTEMLLGDIEKMYRSPNLYMVSCFESWDFWRSFTEVGSDGVPKRFISMSRESMLLVQDTYLKNARGISIAQHVPQSSPVNSSAGMINKKLDKTMEENTDSSNWSNEEDDNVILKSSPSRKNYSEQDRSESKSLLRKEMEPYARLWRCDFRDLEETDEMMSRQPVFMGDVQLSLYDTRKFLSQCLGPNKSSDAAAIGNCMEDTVNLMYAELRSGGHGVLICSIEHYGQWQQKFRSHSFLGVSVESSTQKNMPSFVVDTWPILLVSQNAPFILSKLQFREAFDGEPALFALHVVKKGVPSLVQNAILQQELCLVHSSFPDFANIIDNVKGLVMVSQSKQHRKSHPEESVEKPLEMIMELIKRYTNPGDVVVDRFSGSFVSAKACLSLRQPRRFFGCEADENCHSIGLQTCMETFAKCVLSQRTFCKTSEQTKKAAKVFLDAVRNGRCSHVTGFNNEIVWKPPGNLPPYQSFPPHILAHIGSENMDTTVITKCHRKPFHKWPSRFQEILHTISSDSLLRVEAVVSNVIVAPSRIKHLNAGLGLFAAKSFHPGDIICSYYGTLIYTDMSMSGVEEKKTYGEGVLSVDATRFKKFAMQVQVTGAKFKPIRELIDGKLAVFIVPPTFCVASVINDAKYVEGDEDLEGVQSGLLSKRKPNVTFMPSVDVVRKLDELVCFDLVNVRATDYISPGDELYVDYGKTELV